MNEYLRAVSGMASCKRSRARRTAPASSTRSNEAYRNDKQPLDRVGRDLDAASSSFRAWASRRRCGRRASIAQSERNLVGELFAFIAYIDMFFLPIRDLAARYTLLQSAMTGAERVFELMDNKEEDAPNRAAANVAPLDPDAPALELDNVTFGYKPDTVALREVSMAVKKRARRAGRATGAGKGTVASLFLRLYEVARQRERGRGDVRDWRRESELALRGGAQKCLFPGSGRQHRRREVETTCQVELALERSGLEMVRQREGGLNAIVPSADRTFRRERHDRVRARPLQGPRGAGPTKPPPVARHEARCSARSRRRSAVARVVIAIACRRSALRRSVVFTKASSSSTQHSALARRVYCDSGSAVRAAAELRGQTRAAVRFRGRGA